ncbi:MAG: ATP-binding protein [Oscillospiraceae bacterium]|nr:ATP-binding protein [Oscillospiraceae bacterium]
MREITVDASVDRVTQVTELADLQLAEAGCSARIKMQIDIAIDEIFSNIARYAYQNDSGTVTVRLDTLDAPPRILLTFIDNGIPYNPLMSEMPDTTSLPARKRPIGGLGLFMVKKTMDSITYSYENGQNILTILKNL